MGTNYYVRATCSDPCEHCAITDIHIGKSSAGWAFQHRAYTSDEAPGVDWPVGDFPAWLKLLDIGDIYDEYGRKVAKADLLEMVGEKRDGRKSLYRDDFLDPDGYLFIPGEFS